MAGSYCAVCNMWDVCKCPSTGIHTFHAENERLRAELAAERALREDAESKFAILTKERDVAEAQLKKSVLNYERGRSEMLWLMVVGAVCSAHFCEMDWHENGSCTQEGDAACDAMYTARGFSGVAIRALAELGDKRAREIVTDIDNALLKHENGECWYG